MILARLAGLDEIDIPGFVATFCGRYFVAAVLSVVVSLLVALIVTSDDLTALNVLVLLAKILGFVVVTWVLSAKLLPPAILFLRRFIRVPELSFGLLIGGLFLVVVGAEEIGLHGTIGALLFGAALSGLPEGVRHDILPGLRSASEGLFVPLFFASAGLPEVVPPSYARYALAGVRIGSLLDRTRRYPPSTTTVQGFFDDWVVPNHRDYVVVDDGEVAGVVSMARATRTLRDLLRVRVPRAVPDELIVDVMDRMASNSVTVIPVMDRESGRFLGTLASHDVLDLVALMGEIREEQPTGAATDSNPTAAAILQETRRT